MKLIRSCYGRALSIDKVLLVSRDLWEDDSIHIEEAWLISTLPKCAMFIVKLIYIWPSIYCIKYSKTILEGDDHSIHLYSSCQLYTENITFTQTWKMHCVYCYIIDLNQFGNTCSHFPFYNAMQPIDNRFVSQLWRQVECVSCDEIVWWWFSWICPSQVPQDPA